MTPSQPSLRDEVRAVVRGEQLPGLSVLAFQDERCVFEFMHGTDEQGAPIDRNTIFGVASITKSLTATAVLLLQQEGRLSLDDRVADWLPDLQLPEDSHRRVRVRHLLSHTAGFPGLPLINGARTPSINADPDRNRLRSTPPIEDKFVSIRTPLDLVAALSSFSYRPLGEPGDVFNYSNEGFGLLHAAIEASAGMPFQKYVSERVFAPLGINRTGFTVADLDQLTGIAPLYAPMRADEASFSLSPHWWDVGDIYTNGSWKVSAEGLGAYARMLCAANGASNKSVVLTGSSAAAMTTSFARLPDGSRYGLGAELGAYGTRGTRSWFGHGGRIKGVSSHLRLVPDDGLSVVVLINASDADASSISDLVARRLLKIADAPAPAAVPTPDIDPYLGDYYSAEQHRVSISAQCGNLQVACTTPLPMRYTGGDRFIDAQGRSYVFLRDDRGAVDRVFTGKRVIPRRPTPQAEGEVSTDTGSDPYLQSGRGGRDGDGVEKPGGEVYGV